MGSTPTGGSGEVLARYANGRAAKLKPWRVRVRLPPVLLGEVQIAFGRAVVRQPACKAGARSGNVGSIPTRGTRRTARSSNGLRCQVVNLTTRVQFPYEPLVCALVCPIRPVRLAAQDDRFSTCKRGFDSPTGHWQKG